MDAVALGLAAAGLLLASVALAASGLSLYLRHRERSSARALSRLEGELVIVNTARPDERSYRGLVVRELADGYLELTGAEELEGVTGRGGVADVRAVRMGHAVVPGPAQGANVQLLARDSR